MSQQSVPELHDKDKSSVRRLLKRLFQRLTNMFHETRIGTNETFIYNRNAHFAPFHRENRP